MATTTIWQDSWTQKITIDLGFKKFSQTVTASVAIIFKDGQYIVQIGFMGESVSYPLGNMCYPVMTAAEICTLEVCTLNLIFKDDGKTPKSLTLTVKACIGKWGVTECVKLYNSNITF